VLAPEYKSENARFAEKNGALGVNDPKLAAKCPAIWVVSDSLFATSAVRDTASGARHANRLIHAMYAVR
jgi:hypothetical protein